MNIGYAKKNSNIPRRKLTENLKKKIFFYSEYDFIIFNNFVEILHIANIRHDMRILYLVRE